MLCQRKLARMVIGAVLKTVVNRKVVWVRVLQLPLRGVSGSSPLLDVMSSWCSGNTTRIHCKVAQWESRALLMLWLQVRVLPLQLKLSYSSNWIEHVPSKRGVLGSIPNATTMEE